MRYLWIVCIIFVLLFTACAQEALPAPAQQEPAVTAEPEKPVVPKPFRVTITSDGKTVSPHREHVCSFDGEYFDDGPGLMGKLADVYSALPCLRWAEDFQVNTSEEAELQEVFLYDENLNRVEYDGGIDGLGMLPAGTYYVGIYLMTYGEYDEQEKIRTYSGGDYGICLTIE